MKHSSHVHLTIGLALTLVGPAVAAPPTWEIRSETEYTTGYYGSSIQTEVLYAPLEIRRLFDWGEIGLSIPYLWYRSEGTFSFVNPQADNELQTIPISLEEQGFSDLLFDVKYVFVRQSGNRPEILVRGYWKPPTADSARGLGTGGHDFLLGSEFWGLMPKSKRLFYFGNLYRYFSDGRPGQVGRDSWIYEIGAGGLVTDNLVTKFFTRQQTSTAPGVDSQSTIELETIYSVNPGFRILSGAAFGLSDATPDWRFMLGFEYSF